PDDSHIEIAPEGGYRIVRNKDLNASPATPTATATAAVSATPTAVPTASTAPSASAAPSADAPVPPAATPPPNHGCACSRGEGGETVLGPSAAPATAIIVALRRRKTTGQR